MKKRQSPPSIHTAGVGIIYLVLTLLSVAAVISALTVGSADISLSRVLATFTGEDRTARVIVVGLRLPRLAGAALAGAALATAGQLLQSVTDNELCAPNIIGVNSGSGLAVMLVLSLFPMYWQLLPLAAFIGALAASFFVLLVSGASPGDQKSSLILAGVALSSILGAGISFLSLKYPDVLSSYTAFSVGGFSGVTFDELAIPAVMIIVCFILAMIAAPKINLLCLGDEAAGSLGVRVRRLRVFTIVITSGLCAAAVSFAGLLGFVGLIVPHIIRRICGQRLRRILPITALGGALLVVFSDVIGRTILAPGELPAGIIMALIGAPFFLYLLVRRRRHD